MIANIYGNNQIRQEMPPTAKNRATKLWHKNTLKVSRSKSISFEDTKTHKNNINFSRELQKLNICEYNNNLGDVRELSDSLRGGMTC